MIRIDFTYEKKYIYTCRILIIGLFVYAMGMLLLNLFISPDHLLKYGTETEMQADLRLRLVKNLGELWGFFQAVYTVGEILFLYSFWKDKCAILSQKIVYCFLSVIVCMVICFLLFFVLTPFWCADYLYSVYNVLIWHCSMFIITTLLNYARKANVR